MFQIVPSICPDIQDDYPTLPISSITLFSGNCGILSTIVGVRWNPSLSRLTPSHLKSAKDTSGLSSNRTHSLSIIIFRFIILNRSFRGYSPQHFCCHHRRCTVESFTTSICSNILEIKQKSFRTILQPHTSSLTIRSSHFLKLNRSFRGCSPQHFCCQLTFASFFGFHNTSR